MTINDDMDAVKSAIQGALTGAEGNSVQVTITGPVHIHLHDGNKRPAHNLKPRRVDLRAIPASAPDQMNTIRMPLLKKFQ